MNNNYSLSRQQRRSILTTKSLSWFLLGLITLLASGSVQAQVTGRVFRDFNADGLQNAPISSTASAVGEPGFPGIVVTAYPVAGSPVSLTTAIDGSYSFPNSGITASGAKLRLEFSGLPSGVYSAAYGTATTGSGTSTQFVTAGSSTTANYGVNYPGEYCDSSPQLATPCFVSGTQSAAAVSSEHVLVTFPYSAQSTNTGTLAAPIVSNNVNPTPIADAGQVGSVWGMAFQRETNKLFTAAFLKRHVGLGSGGLGGIYSTSNATGTTTNGTLYVDLEAAPFNLDLGQSLLGTRTLPNTATTSSTDPNSFSLIGKVGLGGMALSEDGTKLYVTDLNNRTLLRLAIGNPAKSSFVVSDLTSISLPATVCTNGVGRPFGVAVRYGKVYVGVVCTGESPGSTTANLSATIYEMDEATQTFSTALTMPLAYPKGYVHAQQIPLGDRWEPWTSSFSTLNLTLFANGVGTDANPVGTAADPVIYRAAQPQAILSDIDFTDNGDMVLTFMDRAGHQLGYKQVAPTSANSFTLYNGYVGGDLLRARKQGSTWVVESGGKVSSSTSGTLTGGSTNNAQGPGSGEFYSNDNFVGDNNSDGIADEIHQETSQGGSVIVPGTNQTITIHMDPMTTWSGGTIWHNNLTGAKTKVYQLYRTIDNSGAQVNGTYGKANGLGLPVALCDPAPVEIGNRVWLDSDKDGIQDPDESPIASVSVGLYQSGTLVATAVTNAKGEYYFSSAPGTSSNSARYGLALIRGGTYELRIATAQTSLAGLIADSPANAGTNEAIDNDFTVSGGNMVTSLTVGVSGNNLHLFDAALTCTPPTLSISDSQTICQGGSFALPLSASVTSGTATGRQWYLTDATGSSFTAIAGATSLTFTPTGTNLPTATGGIKYYAITAYSGTTACSDIAFVSLTIKPTQTITFTAPASVTTTVCANTTLNMSVTSNAVAPDQIRFVYFTEPLASAAEAYTSTEGTVLGTVNSTSVVGNKTVTLSNVLLPDNISDANIPIYVYAILVSADGLCQPVSSRVIILRPRPVASIVGEDVACTGTQTALSSLDVATTYKWFVGTNPAVVSTAQNYSPTVSAITTYHLVISDASGCVSDAADFTVDAVVCNPCVAGPGKIGGNSYRDYNGNGVKDTGEKGVAGLTVQIFVCSATGSSTLVATTTTDLNGDYFAAGLTDGRPYRVEFSNLPAGFEPTARGTNNGTTVQFVNSPTCGVSLGINEPDTYCQANPRLATPCYVSGDASATAPVDVLVSFNYTAPTNPVKQTVANKAQLGSVWGIAYSGLRQKIYSGAFLKRHVGMGPNGLGAIYSSNVSGAANASLLVTIPNAGTIPTNAARNLAGPTVPSFDQDAFAKVGVVGLGDVDISDDEKTLYAVNLNDKKVYIVDVSTQTITGSIDVPNPACSATGDYHPFALAYRRGKLYVGITCDASVSNQTADLKSFVYEMNVATNVFSATPVLTIPLNYPRSPAWEQPAVGLSGEPINAHSSRWHPWANVFSPVVFDGVVVSNTNGVNTYVSHPQPILSDIDFDDKGAMVLGFIDRTGHQLGDFNTDPSNSAKSVNTIVGGDILRAGQCTPGVWTLENGGSICGEVASAKQANGHGPGGGEFYYDELLAPAHYETAQGGIAVLPGSGEVTTIAMDPTAFYSGGIIRLSNTTGKQPRAGFTIYSGGRGSGLFSKANGLGDLTILCNPAPLQIGNRVWRDDNRDGIQDPCEPSIAGAVVKLYDATKTTVLASVTTNAAGEYYFSSTTITAGTSTSSIATSLLVYNTTYGLVITSLGTSSVVTAAALSLTDVSPVTPGESGAINSGTTLANNDAKVDAGLPCIKLTTGGPGDVNHTYDFGLAPQPCVKPELAAIPSQTICQGDAFALPLSSSFVSGTAVSLQWYFTDATSTSQTIIAGATSLTFTPTTVQQPAAGQTRYYMLVAQNGIGVACSDVVTASLTSKPIQTITFTAPASATTTVCANTTLNMSVSTNAVAPDQIRFVGFTSPLASAADAYTATDGNVFGTVNSTTIVGTKTLTLSNVQLPDNVGADDVPLYVYAILVSADGLCQPVAQRVVVLKPRPITSIAGEAEICRGTTTVLVADGPAGTTFQWFLNNGTTAVSTANPFTTPVINTTATYRVRTTFNACVSDDAEITLTPVTCTPCTSGTGTVGGIVFRDFDSDGLKDANDLNMGDITVTIFRCDANGGSVQVAQMQTDIKGQYSFTGLTGGTDYRVEFSSFPAGYEPTYRGTNNGTTIQFTKPGSCSISLGLNQPYDFCQQNPQLATSCYVNGATNATGPTDVLVSFAYNNSGATPAPTHLANKNEIGATWGLAYNRYSKRLYTATFLKRQIGIKDADGNGTADLGVIYITNPATATNQVWADLAKAPYNLNVGFIGTDAQRGLGAPTSTTVDADAYGKVGKAGLGDLEISDDGTALWTVNLNTKTLHKIAINTDGTAGAMTTYALPDPCGPAPTKLFINVGGTLQTGGFINGWIADGYLVVGTAFASGQVGLPYSSGRSGARVAYRLPVANGSYTVKLYYGNNGAIRNQVTRVESTSLTQTLAANTSTTQTATVSVTDGSLEVDVVGVAPGNVAILSGIEITPNDGQVFSETAPFALKYKDKALYVGITCTAEFSQDKANDLTSTVYRLPDDGSTTLTPVLTVPLDYVKGPAYFNCAGASGWYPWSNFEQTATCATYPTPMLADIEFDVDGSMILGYMDRYSHQVGPGSYNLAGTATSNAISGGDILRASYQNGVYNLETNGRAGTLSGGVGNNQGPGGGEFYSGDRIVTDIVAHQETGQGGLAMLPGSGQIASINMDPVDGTSAQYGSGGVVFFSNTNGTKQRAYRIYSYLLAQGTLVKANGLGDLEIFCDLAPIQIGNRVWRDDNRNGIQDPCEPPIAGAVVKLYNAAKTTVLASVTTNAAGEYYFSSGTVVAGTSTSSVATTALIYNTTYGLAISSLGTSTVVTGLSLTDVSPLTPGESGTLNSGNTLNNNDAKVDVVGGISSPCIKLTTGGPGESNHTYDFGIAKFVCSLTATASASSQTVAQGQPVTLTAQATPAGSYTYAWAGSGTITPTNAATVIASNLATGLNTFTVTVTSAPGCFTTAIVSVTVLAPACIISTSITAGSVCGTLTPVVTGGTMPYSYSWTGPTMAVAVVTKDATHPYFGVGSPMGLTIDGLQGKELTLVRGVTYSFNVNTPSHPFVFTNSAVGGSANTAQVITAGVTNGNITSGTVLFTPSAATPNLIYYNCDVHPNMGWRVNIVDQQPNGVLTNAMNGTYSLTVTDGQNCSATTTATVNCPCALTATATPTACNSATNQYSVSGTISLTNSVGGVAIITDGSVTTTVPVAASATSVTYSLTGLVSNGASHTVTVSLAGCGIASTTYAAPASCTVCSLSLTTSMLANGQIGSAYSETLTTSGGTAPISYTVLAGTLPTSLTLNASTGVISGTPTAPAGTASFTVKVSDSKSCSAVQPLTITTSALPVCELTATATPGVCQSATNQYVVTGSVSATNAIVNGASPQNLTISVGSVNTVVVLTGNGPVSYTLSGLTSDGLVKTVSVLSSASVCGMASATYAAPASCLKASLGDFVWYDTNGNGQQDNGETGVPGVVVKLYNPLSSTSTPIASLTTDSDGKYLFTNLTPGVYCVIFDKATLPVGYTLTTPNSGTDATDSDADLITGKTTNYTLAAGEQNLTVDAGIKPLPASLGDKVFTDLNGNGIQNAGDTPIPGVIVTLISNGTVVATTTTLSSGTGIGCYSFTGLTPGVPYSVSFTTPVGFTATTPLSGTDRTNDSNPVGGITAPVTLTAGENNPTLDAGFIPLKASLGDYVWFDTNKNGVQDGTESGVQNVTVVLCDAVSAIAISTTLTDGNGLYLFPNLNPGSYVVKFTAPAGTTFTIPNSSSATLATDSNVASVTGQRGSTAPVSLTAGENNLTIDGGLIPVPAPPSLTVVVSTPICNTLTNNYTATGTVSLTNSPAGSLTITDNGTVVAVVSVTAGQISASFSVSGVSGSAPPTHTVVASLATATASTTYATPVSCTLCSLSVTASAVSQTICIGQPVTVFATVSPAGSYSYSWATPAGAVITGSGSATATITGLTTAGVKTFTVTVSSSPSCFTTTTVSITAIICCVQPVLSVAPQSQTVCEGSTPAQLVATVTSGTAVSYQWYGPSNSTTTLGALIGGATSLTYSPPGSTTGTVYYVIVAQTAAGSVCSGSAVASVTINSNPVITLVSLTVCEGQAFTLAASATPGNATTSWKLPSCADFCTGGSPIISASATQANAGLYIYKAISNGCSTTAVATVTVNAAPNAGSDQSLSCVAGVAPTITNLVATSATGGVWSAAAGNPTSTSFSSANALATTVLGLNAPGSYTFVFTSPQSCTDALVVTIPICQTVCVQPVVSTVSGNNQTVCAGTASQPLVGSITSGTAVSFQWYGPASSSATPGTLIMGATSLTYSPPASSSIGTVYYTLIAQSASGSTCSGSAVAMLTVSPAPAFTATSTTVCSGTPLSYTAFVQMGATTTYSVHATLADAQTNANRLDPQQSFSINAATVYYVRGREINSNCIAIQSLTLTPVNCSIPTASLGDKVFADNNRNGIQDAGDTPIPGVTVTLISNGTVVATTTTLSSGTGIGCYSFTYLTPGMPYSVSFTTPVGFTATTPLSGTDTTKDSDPVNGITAPVTLTAGENNPTIDAGFVPPILLQVIVSTPVCNTLTNNYTATGTVSLTNSPAGSLTITDNSTVVAVVSVTAGQPSASFTLSGVSGSSPATHTVVASLATATASTTYATPASCTVCSLSATASAAVTICAGQSATLTATALGGTAGYSYGWQPAATLSGATTATAIAAPTATTTYSVIVTDAKNCTALATVTVTVNGVPTIVNMVRGACIGNTTSVTANASLTGAGTLEYSFNGGVSFQPANTTTVTANGPTMVTVIVRTVGSSCTATGSITVDCACANPATVSLLPASPVTCGQTPVSLTASVGGGATSATLTSSGTGTFSNALVTGSMSLIYTPSVADVTAGSVTLSITSADPDGAGSCLTVVQTRVLLINPIPTILLSSTTVCAGASAILTASGGANSYTFAPAGGVQTGNVYVVVMNTTTVYSVTGTTGTCSNTASGTVTVLPKPTVGSNQTLVCANGVVPGSTTLTAQTNSSVLTGQWFAQPGNPNATTFANATSLTTTVSGLLPGQTYQFVWANTNSCADDLFVTVGICPTVAVGSLGNYVWKDNNNNGLQDPNEPGVANVRVELFTVVSNVISSTPLATTVTSASGLYAFTGLPQGDYRVKFTLPASETVGCDITDKVNAGPDTRDSDVDPLTGFSPVVSINPSGTGIVANNPTIDLGVKRKVYDPVGYIYCYANNAILTGGRINVTGPGSISIIKDGSDGSYQFFTDGTPGSYTVTYTHPNGYSVATVQRPVAGSVVDPTALDGSSADRDGIVNGIVQLGSVANSTTNPTSLLDGSAAANPFYLVFNVAGGDPFITDNNLPVDCSVVCPTAKCIPITISKIR